MNHLLSERINLLSESQTLAMARLSRELKEKGMDVISLSIGEPDFDTPEFIKDAAKKAIDNNLTHYTPVPGTPEVRTAICKKLKRDNNLSYTPSQIVVSTGAKQSLANIALSLLNKGDEVLLPAPYWVSYYEIVKLGEATPIVVPTSVESDFKITPEQLEKYITPKTRMIWYSSPCNPSGSVYTKEELEGLAAVIKKHPDLLVVSDEIYEHINFEDAHYSIAQIEEMQNKTIIVNGVSKGFAMTGWRIGFIAAPQWIADACTKMQGQFTSGANSIAQAAAAEAFNAPKSVTFEMKKTFDKRRHLVFDLLSDIPNISLRMPKGAFYMFPDVSYYFGKSDGNKVIKDADDLAMYLLNNYYIAVVSGNAFGNPNCIRLSYATSEDLLIEACKRLKEGLINLK